MGGAIGSDGLLFLCLLFLVLFLLLLIYCQILLPDLPSPSQFF